MLTLTRQVQAEPVMHFTLQANNLGQPIKQDGMIDRVECRTKIQKDQQGHVLRVHFQKNIVHDFEQGRLCAMVFTIRRLQFWRDVMGDHLTIRLYEHSLFCKFGNIL